jgi:2-polyprenyl-3-methyl-5-hydroxy-6-metoxy-1,4-benzoquinol methylase
MSEEISSKETVLRKNQEAYASEFAATDPGPILARLRDPQGSLKAYYDRSIGAEVTWGGGLLERLPGARVLEIGAGSGETACMMLGLGAAHVTATEITEEAADLMRHLRSELGYEDRLDVHIGDFLTMDLGEPHSYDLVVLREVLHHIPTEIEDAFVARTAHFLAHDGMTRFKDPAVNSKLLDEMRWAVPTPGRPSKVLQPAKFEAWREADAHPIRDNSTQHYVEIMRRHYGRVEGFSLGTVSRFHRLVNSDKYNARAMRRLSQLDIKIPQRVHMVLGNAQRESCFQPLDR